MLFQVGKGANMKLVVNMMMGTMMTTLAEGLTLAQKADLSQKDLIEVLGLGFMNAPLFAMKVFSFSLEVPCSCTAHSELSSCTAILHARCTT